MHCLQHAHTKDGGLWSDNRVGGILELRMRDGLRPTRPSGPAAENEERDPVTGRPYWNAKTYTGFLRHRTAPPSDQVVERIIANLGELVAEQIWPSADLDAMKTLLRTPGNSIAALAQAILARAPTVTRRWQGRQKHRPFRSASFTFSAGTGSAPGVKPVAKRARSFLKKLDGPRAFFVGGPAYSGKKTVLRHFLAACDDGWFVLGDQSALPVFAASLYDQAPTRLIDELYEFYLSGQDFREEYTPAVRETTKWKLLRIEAMARTTPACILFADTDPISQDDVFRSLSDGPIDAVIAILLGAHPLTRLLFTTSDAEDADQLYRAAKRLCHACEQEKLDGRFEMAKVAGLSGATPMGQYIDGRTWRLAWITSRLIGMVAAPKHAGFVRQREYLIRRNDSHGLTRLLWEDLLDPEQRTLLGTIAMSQDGLRLSVLRRILAALRRAETNDVLTEESLPRQLSALSDLITEHHFDIEDELLDPGDADSEPVYSVDQDWRTHFLERWWQSDCKRARFGHWLIAREATDQARRLRLAQVEVISVESIGREIQALHALIASIDPSGVRAHSTQRLSGDIEKTVEAIVLPSLMIDAEMPDPLVALRFAYLFLYRMHIEGPDYELLRIHEDAATRLNLLLPLFAPERPWLSLRERNLPTTVPVHISSAFDHEEIVGLLASIAIGAKRLRRFDIVLAAVNAGERESTGVNLSCAPALNHMRLFRTRIDAGILLAGLPNRLIVSIENNLTRLSNMGEVIQNIIAVLEGDLRLPDTASGELIPLLVARAKLQARLGEAYHCFGALHRAEIAFRSARATEVKIVNAEAVGDSMSPVLGGRGARRYVRLLVDLALRRAYLRRPISYVFGDGLRVPGYAFPADVLPETPLIQLLIDINCRRLSPGHLEDSVALKIEAARVASMRRRPGSALRLLDAAQSSLRLSTGSDFELLLEYFALRTHIQAQSAMSCFAHNDGASDAPLDDVIENLRNYLTPRGSDDVRALGADLIGLARTSKGLLDEMTRMLASQDPPAAIVAELLEATILMGETRISNAGDGASTLDRAATAVRSAMKAMHETKFRLHWWHARETQRGIRHALPGVRILP